MKSSIQYDDYSRGLIRKLHDASKEGDDPEVIEAVLQKDLSSKIEEESEDQYKRKISSKYFYIVLALFVLSYLVLLVLMPLVFYEEKALIKDGLLNAEDRSINSTTVSVVIAATITQVGAAFFSISRYLFPGNKKIETAPVKDK